MSDKLDKASEFLIHLDLAGKNQVTLGRECFVIDNVIDKLVEKDMIITNITAKLLVLKAQLEYDINRFDKSEYFEYGEDNRYELCKQHIDKLDEVLKFIEEVTTNENKS